MLEIFKLIKIWQFIGIGASNTQKLASTPRTNPNHTYYFAYSDHYPASSGNAPNCSSSSSKTNCTHWNAVLCSACSVLFYAGTFNRAVSFGSSTWFILRTTIHVGGCSNFKLFGCISQILLQRYWKRKAAGKSKTSGLLANATHLQNQSKTTIVGLSICCCK